MGKIKSPGHQVSEMLRQSGLAKIGESSRTEETRQAIENGCVGRHEIAGQTNIHSTLTLDKYKSIWRDFASYCKSNGFRMRDATAENVKDYMQNRIDSGCSRNTLDGIGSALNKLDDGLNRAYGGSRDFSNAIREEKAVGNDVCPRLDTESRAFHDPATVISNIESQNCRLAAEIQLETGLRAMNVCDLHLNPNNTLFVQSKAGYVCTNFKIPRDLYNQLAQRADADGNVHLTDYKSYIKEIRTACEAAGEHYTGSHAFRHNFAQNMYSELRNGGMSDYKAKIEVSEALFHHRLDVVEKYLR